MLKSISTFILLFSSLLLNAQDYNTAVGVKLYPGVATIRNSIVNDWERFSFSGGIDVKQRIFRHKLFLETGINYFDRGIGSEHNITDEFGNPAGTITSRELYSYLNIPLSITYQFKGFYIGGGPNVNFYMGRKYIVDDSLITTERNPYIDNTLIGCQLFAGYEKQFANRFLFSAEAFVNPVFKWNFVNYGVGIGLKYIVTKPKS